MFTLRVLSSIGRSGTVLNSIYKSPHRTLASYYQYRESPVKLISIGIYHNDRLTMAKCKFHTTQRLCIPPILAIAIRPVSRVCAFLFGHLFQRWWSRRSLEEKEDFKQWFNVRRRKIYGTLGFFLTSLLAVYVLHLETDPLTGRKRFILLNDKQQNALAKIAFEEQMESCVDSLVPENHPTFLRLSRIIDRLVKANEDLPGVAKRKWSLTVVDSHAWDVFALPNGDIFFFLGALEIIQNDDQLATILAHEMAHVVLQHSAETLSMNFMLDILLFVPIGIIWAMFPDLLAALLHTLDMNITKILLTLPYSRKLENEADEVGLKLSAKACFDGREAVVLWG